MITLGLDTATADTAVALTTDSSERRARDEPAPGERPRHATALLPLAAALLKAEGITWTDLDLIAAGIGPGTFTGLRIGIATARALAQSANVELVGISSLRALATAATEGDPARPAAGVIDARRGEIFVAVYAGAREVLEPQALEPAAAADVLARMSSAGSEPLLAVGDGALRFREVLEQAGVVVAPEDSELHRVNAAVICRLAATGQVDANEPVKPHYARVPDAELTRRSADR